MSRIDQINESVNTHLYPLGLPAKHLQKRIPATLTMNRIVMYYTVWNWVIMLIALATGWERVVMYSQASCLLIASIVAVAWAFLQWPFFKSFYKGILMTDTNWLIAFSDGIVHFLPVFIMGLPTRIALPVFMPLLTFWVWYMAMRPHLKTLYASSSDEAYLSKFDTVTSIGTLIWLIAIVILTSVN